MTSDQYRNQREKLGLTQAELASLLGLPRTAVTKRENGEQRITEEAAIALRALPRAKAKRGRRPQNEPSSATGPPDRQNSPETLWPVRCSVLLGVRSNVKRFPKIVLDTIAVL